MLFGESRVQEARAKIPLLPGRARWHFIGHLQNNKIRHALPLFELFHGIDSLEIARDLDRIAGEAGVFPEGAARGECRGRSEQVRLLAGEAARADRGVARARAAADRRADDASRRSAPRGGGFAPVFRRAARAARSSCKPSSRVPLPQLSMGMSGDYAVAVEEGATLVRVGTAIFGDAQRKGVETGQRVGI